MLHDKFLQQGAENLRELIAEFRNCKATILHNAFPHKLRKVSVTMDGLSLRSASCTCKLPALATHHPLAHDVRPIEADDKFRSALCSMHSKTLSQIALHSRRSRKKSLHLQSLQRCHCENSGSPASAYVMRRHYSIMYTQSLHSTNGLLAVGRVGNSLCGLPLYKCNF